MNGKEPVKVAQVIEEPRSFRVGESASLSKTVTDSDIFDFVRATGDDNPVHTSDEYARESFFGGRIAHGMLVAGLVSAVLGTKLPGPGCIYMRQQLQFTAPVRPGDTIEATATVIAWDPEKGRVTLSTEVKNQDDVTVLKGEALLVMQSFLTATNK